MDKKAFLVEKKHTINFSKKVFACPGYIFEPGSSWSLDQSDPIEKIQKKKQKKNQKKKPWHSCDLTTSFFS